MDLFVNKKLSSSGYKVINIKALDAFNNQVFLVTTPQEELIIKLFSDKDCLEKDVNMRAYLRRTYPHLPIPKTIYQEDHFLILERLPGEPLNKAYNELTNKKSFFEQLGKIKATINEPRSAYADFNEKLEPINQETSWLNKQEKKYDKIKNKLPLIYNDFWEGNKQLLTEDTQPVLAHADTTSNNILVHNNQVSGIIDFEFANISAGIHDLFSSTRSQELLDNQEHIIKGYEKIRPVTKNYKQLIQLYQWLAHTKTLTQIPTMKWHNINKKEQDTRREELTKNTTEQIKKIMEEFDKNMWLL